MQICVFSLSSSSIDQNLAYSCPLSRMAETRNSLAGDTQENAANAMPIMTMDNVLLMKKFFLWSIRVHTCRFRSISNN